MKSPRIFSGGFTLVEFLVTIGIPAGEAGLPAGEAGLRLLNFW